MAKSRPLLVVDVETTGQNPLKHWMPCFGACVVDEQGNSSKAAQFLCYLEQPLGTTWDDQCVAQFWRNKKKAVDGVLLYDQLLVDAERHGRWEPSAGMARFCGWLKRMLQRYPELQVASDNPSYDVAWLDHYLRLYAPAQANLAYCAGEWRAILDIRSYALGRGKTLSVSGKNHNPLVDALQLGREFRALDQS